MIFYILLISFLVSSSKLVACEKGTKSNQMPISCTADYEYIHIIEAVYGRYDVTTCPYTPSEPVDVNCGNDTSFAIVKDKCHGRKDCVLTAENETFGDPCYLTQKYLEVTFACIASGL